jgi:hypothetical protein
MENFEDNQWRLWCLKDTIAATLCQYRDFMTKAKPKFRRDFDLGLWLPKQIHKNAEVSLSLTPRAGGMHWLDEIERRAEPEIRKQLPKSLFR